VGIEDELIDDGLEGAEIERWRSIAFGGAIIYEYECGETFTSVSPGPV